jgi:hypothetical protein
LALAGDIEQEAGILSAHPVIELDQQLAERKVEHPRDDQDRRAHRHAGRFVDARQAPQ